MEDVRTGVRTLFDVPNPSNEGLIKRADLTIICEALGWKVEAIAKACKANKYGVVEYEDWEALMLSRCEANFAGRPEGFIKKLKNQAAKVRAKMKEMKKLDEPPSGEIAGLNIEDNATESEGTMMVEEPLPPAPPPSYVYRCQKCRTPLFTSNDVDHSGDYAEASEEKRIHGKCWNKGQVAVLAESHEAVTSIFLPQEVAAKLGNETNSGADTGKLYCPNIKCNNKIGSFRWSGEQDNKGHFHCPSFNVPKSKVDMMPTTAIRQASLPIA